MRINLGLLMKVREMASVKLSLSVKSGIAIVAVSWFAFTFFEFVSGIIHASNRPWYIMVTDTLGSVGLGFRALGGFVAVITIVLFFFVKRMGKAEALMSFRWILLFESGYYAISFIPAALWGVGSSPFSNLHGELLGNLVVNFIPCMVAGILIPVVLVKLFFELSSDKPISMGIKWGLIAGVVYVFVFWLNYMGNWVFTEMYYGVAYVTLPANLFSFLLTTVGLLVLAFYAAYFAHASIGVDSWRKLNLRKIGAIVTAFGLYFDVIYLLWIFVGSVGGWSSWYAWFLGHNVDLWLLTLPLAGLPLLFHEGSPSTA